MAALEVLELQLTGMYGGSSVYPLISKECCKEIFNQMKDLVYLDSVTVDLNYNGFDQGYI